MNTSLLRSALVLCALAALPREAAAQPARTAEDPNFAEARRHFEAGVTAMQAEQWPEALAAFEQAHRLRRSAAASLNLGITLHRLGRLLEARVRLQEFLELATPPQRQAHEAEAQRLIAEVNRRVGRIRVTALEPAHAALTVDGRRAALNDAQEIDVDPGERAVGAEAAGFVPFTRALTVGPGVTESIEVRMSPVAAPAAPATPSVGPTIAPSPLPPAAALTAPTAPARAASPSIFTRWWFWTGVAVVATGATVGILRATSSTDPLPVGNTGRVVSAATGSLAP